MHELSSTKKYYIIHKLFVKIFYFMLKNVTTSRNIVEEFIVTETFSYKPQFVLFELLFLHVSFFDLPSFS